MPFRLTLWPLLVAPPFAFGQAEEPAKYDAEIVRRHGGPEPILKTFSMAETHSTNGGKKNSERVS